MHGIFVLHFLDLFELLHPTCVQMTVLQAHPVTCLLTLRDEFLSNFSLTLSERNDLQSLTHASFFGKCNQISDWISTGRKYENDWHCVLRISSCSFKIKWRTFNILWSKLSRYEFFNCINKLFFSHDFNEHELLELRKSILIHSWKWHDRVVSGKDLFPD